MKVSAVQIDHQRVTDVIVEVGKKIVLPRWRNLKAHEIKEKSGPHDLVTIADREAEEALTPRLQDILPGSLVLGEERFATEPGVLANLQSEQPVWIIDPVDGTKNFTEGDERFGTIVALVHRGEILSGWIHHPVTGDTMTVERGSGAWFRGKRLAVIPAAPLPMLHGTLGTRLHDPVINFPGQGAAPEFDKRSFVSCDVYVAMLTGERIFPQAEPAPRQQAFRITLMGSKPWDDAAGVLAVREGGGEVIDWTGQIYRPEMFDTGVIAGSNLDTCLSLREWLMPAHRAAMQELSE